MRPIPHGTRNGYSHYGCRCDECQAANSAWRKAQRSRWKATGHVPGAAPQGRKTGALPHGTVSGYTYWGCRCDRCTGAMRVDSTKRAATNNADTLEKAFRHGQEWTEEEMEVVARGGLTARQVAEMLGRSLYSVQNMRRVMKESRVKPGRASTGDE